MRRPGLTLLVATTMLSSAVAASPARGAEAPVGSRPASETNLADNVPELRVGLAAKRAEYAEGSLFAPLAAKRCAALAYADASLVESSRVASLRHGRPLGRRALRLRGAGRRSLKLAAYLFRFGGIDPAATVLLVGRLPRDLAAGERRRTITLALTVQSEDEGCLGQVGRQAGRLLPALYLRSVPAAPPPVPALPSNVARIDAAAYDRIGGIPSLSGTPTQASPAGDLDADGLGDILLQGGQGNRRTAGLIRFGGPPSLSHGQALGGRGFAIFGRFDDATLGSVIGAGGDFTGDGRDDLAIGVQGTDRRGRRPRPPQEDAVIVIPGAHYGGRVDASRPPAGSSRVTVKPGCSPFETRVDGVGDVNGDGVDDLAIDRSDGCGPGRAGILFGGWRGKLSLDALGPAGITLDSRELPGDFAPAGDVNGDGLDDVALPSTPDVDAGADHILLLLGRRTAGPVSLKKDPGVVRLTGRRCNDLTEVASAGDLNGDGADELAIGVQDCHDRRFSPTVAHILRGSRDLRGTIRLPDSSGSTVRSRFGPLGGTQVAAGRDVSGGRAPDLALGFPSGGPGYEGEAWAISDVRLGEQLTLGALGPRGRRLVGPTYRESFGSDVAMGPDATGDGRADLTIISAESEFDGESPASSAYTLAPTGQAAPRCSNRLSGGVALYGTDGGDRITGSPGPDRIVGFLGADCLFGEDGADRLVGDPGADELNGDSGNDRLNGGSGRDRISGGPGADLLDGGDQPDNLSAGPGDDRIDARGSGGDRVGAGPGRDFIRSSDRARDTIDCGPGRDQAISDPGDRVRNCERVTRRSPKEYDD